MKTSIVVLVAVIAVVANAHECGFLSVRDFGAKGDGVTDDTAAIQSGLDYLAARGGGKLYFPFTTNGYLIASPAKEYAANGRLVRAQLVIPPGMGHNIRLEGEMPCKMLYSYQVRPKGCEANGYRPTTFGFARPCNTTLHSTWEAPEVTDPKERPWAVIAAPEGDLCAGKFSVSILSFANLEIRVHLDREKMYPTTSAANFHNVSRLIVEDSQFCLDENVGDTNLGKELQPSPCHTVGLMASGDQNDNQIFRNVAAQGFKYGFVFGEHTCAEHLYVHNTEYAISFADATHPAIINRVVAQHNTRIFCTLPNGTFGRRANWVNLIVNECDYETGAGTLPKISRLQYGVYDPDSRFRGNITYLQGYPGNGKCFFPVKGGTNLVLRVLGAKYDGASVPADDGVVFKGGLWRTFTYDAPTDEPIVFSGESRCEDAFAQDYCLWLDIWYSDGTPVWGVRAEWSHGTHGWERTVGAFVPKRPVKKIEMYALLRKGKGEAEFRNLRLERREGAGEVLGRGQVMTERPYANRDRIVADVFAGRKVERRVSAAQGTPIPVANPLAADDTVVWVADSMRRITPITFPCPADAQKRVPPVASVSLARRERESFQVQVSTGAEAEWTDGGVTLPVLRNAKGKALKGTLEWRRVGYVAREPGYYEHPLGAPQTEMWLPDPLLPPAPFKVRKGSTQGLWFTVYAAPDAVAGEYSGDVVLTERGKKRATVHVTVKVEDFALPETFGMATSFSVMDGFTRAQYPDRFKEKRRESWDIMLDHRLNPDDISRTTPPDIDDLRYARSRGMNLFNILNIVPEPKNPKTKWVCYSPPEATENPAFYPAFKARLTPYVAELRKHGLDKFAYLYGFDERESRYYSGIDVLWKKLKADFPNIPVMTTAMMYRDYAAGKTNLPCLVTTDWYCPLTDVYRTDVSDEMRKLGKKVWWYVCCGPKYPYANFASLEYPLIEGRLLGWMTHLYRADGLLYWHVNFWNGPCIDESDTFLPSWKTYSSLHMPSDGVLLYPGKDHILPSIRLAQIRDCVEDYEWLQLAAAKSGAHATDAVSKTLIRSLTDFTRDPAELRTARRKIARLIAFK